MGLSSAFAFGGFFPMYRGRIQCLTYSGSRNQRGDDEESNPFLIVANYGKTASGFKPVVNWRT
jgi:hypothetical protein